MPPTLTSTVFTRGHETTVCAVVWSTLVKAVKRVQPGRACYSAHSAVAQMRKMTD